MGQFEKNWRRTKATRRNTRAERGRANIAASPRRFHLPLISAFSVVNLADRRSLFPSRTWQGVDLKLSMPQPLDHETALFDKNVEKWRNTHLGEFVLIRGDEIVGFYQSLEKAFTVGTGRFGLEPFLVRQIVPKDVVNVSLYGRRIHVA